MKKSIVIGLCGAMLTSPLWAAPLPTSSSSTGVVNADFDAASSMPVTGTPNVQSTIVTQQMNLLAQIQKLQQGIADLSGVVENQAQQLQQLQLNLQTMQQNLKQQGINVPAMDWSSESPMPIAAAKSGSATTATTLTTPVATTQATQALSPAVTTATAPVPTPAPTISAPVTPTTSQATPVAAPAPTPAPVTSANPATTPGSDQKLYQMGYQQVQNKDYSAAISSFQQYIQTYPQGTMADKVHYWLGQLYGISGNDQQSLAELKIVVTNYPKSDKAPDAMLQLGMMSYSNGEYQDATKWFNQLISQYPTSPSASVAKQQIKQLQRAGY